MGNNNLFLQGINTSYVSRIMQTPNTFNQNIIIHPHYHR